jgi:hypothetical protein
MHTFENPRGEAGRVGILFEKISRGREVHYHPCESMIKRLL